MITKRTAICAIAATLSFACVPALAGMRWKDGGSVTKFTFLEAGGVMVDAGRMNDGLSANGLAGFSDYAASLGIGRSIRAGRLVMEKQVYGIMWGNRTAGNTRGSLWSGQMLSSSGVNVLPQSLPVSLFPYAGLGAGLTVLGLYDDSRTFSDAVASPRVSSTLAQPTILLTAGLGSDFAVNLPRIEKTLGIGVRVGYTYDPSRRDTWWSDGTRITDGPEPVLSGVYGKLVIGKIGSISFDKMKCGDRDR